MSFIYLTESQVAQPVLSRPEPQPANLKSSRGNKNSHKGPEEPHSKAHEMERINKLFEILSARSDIDHPVCVECTDMLVEGLQKKLEGAARERDAYVGFLKQVQSDQPSEEDVKAQEEALKQAKQAEAEAMAELLRLEKEKAAVDAEIIALEEDAQQLDRDEELFWRERNAFATKLADFQNERDSINSKFDNDAQLLEKLQRSNVYNDTFCISHDGTFATINGLRLGRTSSKPVDWPEINAAWGHALLLLVTVADKLGYKFDGFEPQPMGSTSKIVRYELPSPAASRIGSHRNAPPPAPKKHVLELFSNGDLPLGLTFMHRKFDNAMVAFLELVRQLGAFVHRQTAASGHPLSLPYKIDGDKIMDTIDDETFEEVAFRRVPPLNDEQSLVLQDISKDQPAPEILYVLQYIGVTGKSIDTRESDTPFEEIPEYGTRNGESTAKKVTEPVLEVVTKVWSHFKARPRRRPPPRSKRHYDSEEDEFSPYSPYSSDIEINDNPSRPAGTERTHMIIHSSHLINALRATVAYYPNVNLFGDIVKIDAPYHVIVHHRDALARYKSHQPACHSSEYARVTAEHIDILLNFIEKSVGESIRKEEERHQRNTPVATFENYWMVVKPGEVVYVNHEDVWQPLIVSSINQLEGSDEQMNQWVVTCWLLEMGRSKMQRKMVEYKLSSWVGEQVIHSLDIVPSRFFPDDPVAMLQKQVRLGKLYWDLLQRPTYMEYDGLLVQNSYSRRGPALREPSGYMTGRVICDAEGFRRFHLGPYGDRDSRSHKLPGLPPSHGPPPVLDYLPHFRPRCGCKSCPITTDQDDQSPYAEFENIKPTKSTPPTSDLFYIACIKVMPGFLLGKRDWGHLYLEHLKPVVTDREAFKYLVLDDEIKTTVKALIGKFAANDSGRVSPWGNDFVKNKGEGRIFLLHGAPGVGKTCTAECVAEMTNRPLISLTSGDLSVDSRDVETNLSYFLELGQRFGALVLLDEADVYLERRRSKDIDRNGLVSVFLRALEYYRGVLFLTTNRVQAFDAAFTSRIHVALHYQNLTDLDRERIWANNFERLDKDSAGRVRVSVATRDYAYESRDVRSLRWNGREIRNALQTALALAESDAAEEGSDRVTITDKHLRAVVKMSRGFRDYLRSGNVYDGESEADVEEDDEEGELYSE
nr:ATPase [Colletotrichum truncatum]KAF6798317.1 ATPase [Colletotrichum truncatum]